MKVIGIMMNCHMANVLLCHPITVVNSTKISKMKDLESLNILKLL